MKLVTNGCSFTYGAEILLVELGYDEIDNGYYKNYRESRTYTHHLHNKLKTTEYENLAMGGSSNKRIIRTTLEYFMPKINQGIDLSDHIAVIQWSEPFREEVYHPKTNLYYTLSAQGVWYLPLDREELNETYHDYIKGRLMLDDKNFANQFMHDTIMMAAFLEFHKIKYVFAHIASSQWKMPELDENYAPNLNWFNKTYKDSSFRMLIEDNERKNNISLSYPKKHPNIEGHMCIAESLYKRLQELYNL